MNMQDELMQRFIIKDYLDHNKYLALNPRKQALQDYMENPEIRCRVNEIVGTTLEIVAKYVEVKDVSGDTEKD